jgi:hypothetical protein
MSARAHCAVINALLSLYTAPIRPGEKQIVINTECDQNDMARLVLYSPRHLKRLLSDLKSVGIIKYSYWHKYELDIERAKLFFGDALDIDEFTFEEAS